jgi:hypothetical protein
MPIYLWFGGVSPAHVEFEIQVEDGDYTPITMIIATL